VSGSRWAPTSAPAPASPSSRRACRRTSCSSCSGDQGLTLQPAHLLHLATAAGADALGLDEVGDLGVGKRFDAMWLRPRPSTTLDVALHHADGTDDALAKVFALASPADVERVWVDGRTVHIR
jgi:guanine deaminase